MTTASTSLLGLALPVTGELSGTWGDTVNNSITSLLDSAIAGTTTITADADIVLSTTALATNESRQAIIKWATASGTTTRNITAPAQSKVYIVINAATAAQSIVFRGVGPTTGVTIAQNEKAIVAWNGSDFVKVGSSSGGGTVTSVGWTGGIVSVATATTTPAFTIAGTSGGIPYFNSATTWATSAALTQYGVLYGGGPGVAPAATSAGITGQVLVANTGGAPTWGAVVGVGDVVGPASATTGAVALFDGTTGKLIKNSSTSDATINSVNIGLGQNNISTNLRFGVGSLQAISTGNNNIAFGTSAMTLATTATYNIAIGIETLKNLTTGSRNVAIGWNTLRLSGSCSRNTALGHSSMGQMYSGSENVAVGDWALSIGSANNNCTAVGLEALMYATGSSNTALGWSAGTAITTGTNNVLLGSNSAASVVDAFNQIVIGTNGVGQGNNYVSIGSGGTNYIYNAFNTNATWTKASDIRIKKNIQDVAIGLNFIKDINVKSYNWRPNNEYPENIIGYNKENTQDTITTMYGLMAQEVKAAMDKHGFEHFAGWNVRESDGLQGVSTESFVLPLINAVKELSAQIESMKAEIYELKNR